MPSSNRLYLAALLVFQGAIWMPLDPELTAYRIACDVVGLGLIVAAFMLNPQRKSTTKYTQRPLF